MKARTLLFVVAIIATLLGSLPSAQATIVSTGVSDTAMGTYAADAADLVNGDQATLSSAVRSHGDLFSDAISVPYANNGLVKTSNDLQGEYFGVTFGGEATRLPVAYTFMLNTTSANPQGYDITRIDSFAGWTANNRSLANQVLTVEISKINDSNWFALGTFTYTPFDLTTTGDSETRLRLTNGSGGVLNNGVYAATGVDGVRITYLDNGSAGASSNDGVVVQEIDIVGQATATPEPSTMLLLVSGCCGLLAYAWRKRR